MPYKDKAEKVANGKAYYAANKERINARNAANRVFGGRGMSDYECFMAWLA